MNHCSEWNDCVLTVGESKVDYRPEILGDTFRSFQVDAIRVKKLTSTSNFAVLVNFFLEPKDVRQRHAS